MNKLRIILTAAACLAAIVSCNTLEQEQPAISIMDNTSVIVVPQEGGQFDITIEANVEYTVSNKANWIKEANSKSMQSHTHSFVADPLPLDVSKRSDVIRFSSTDGSVSKTVTVVQKYEAPLISFQDNEVKKICVQNWDLDKDGEISLMEAATVTNLEKAFKNNHSITAFPELEYFTGLKDIPEYAFYDCTSLRNIQLPGQIQKIDRYAFNFCISLNTITIPAGVTSIGDSNFYECEALSRIDILAVVPPALGKNVFPEQGCLIYVPQGRATTYNEAEQWQPFAAIITEEGHLPKDFFYRSTDFSADGEVVCLQKATKGKGINIVFLGDGFVDKDMAPGGKYEQTMRNWTEQFFVYEPYKTFRDWFNVYTVKVVSTNNVYGSVDAERRLSRNMRDDEPRDNLGHNIATADFIPVCKSYAAMIPDAGQETRIAVFLNTTVSLGRSFCSHDFYGNCMAFMFEPITLRPTVINHELGGHGFALLADEYAELDQALPDAQDVFEGSWDMDYRLNLDWRSDPATVRWSRFLSDQRYAGEDLGVFEGGLRYKYGVYRASFNSIMRYDTQPGAVFNAPSREAIYMNIMRWGADDNWQYDFETFVEADAAGRQQAAEAYAQYPPTKSPAIYKNDIEPGLPPILADDAVKEIIVSLDGTITLIH